MHFLVGLCPSKDVSDVPAALLSSLRVSPHYPVCGVCKDDVSCTEDYILNKDDI